MLAAIGGDLAAIFGYLIGSHLIIRGNGYLTESYILITPNMTV